MDAEHYFIAEWYDKPTGYWVELTSDNTYDGVHDAVANAELAGLRCRITETRVTYYYNPEEN